VKIQWSPAATALARRYLRDQNGMRAIGVAVTALAHDPYPPEAFHRGRYHRLRVGRYRGLPKGLIVVIVFGLRTFVPAVSGVGEHREPCVGCLRAIRSRLVVSFLAAYAASAG
jgi:hypothetical protein